VEEVDGVEDAVTVGFARMPVSTSGGSREDDRAFAFSRVRRRRWLHLRSERRSLACRKVSYV
jgi:hypothetical protein